MKGIAGPAFALLAGLYVLTMSAEGLREEALFRLSEQGFPQLSDPDSTVEIRGITWSSGDPFKFSEIETSPFQLRFDAWTVRFTPKPLTGTYDTACGSDCQSAIVARGMTCSPGGAVLQSFGCELHAWTLPEGEHSCFFTLIGDLPKMRIADMDVTTVARETPLECPTEWRWRAR